MSKKKNTQPQKSNKLRLILIIGAIAVVLAAGVGLLLHYFHEEEPTQIAQYNSVLTSRARSEGYISNYEVIIIHTIDDSPNGYTQLEAYIYQLPDGVTTAQMLEYYAHELPEKWNAEQIGTASARLLKDDIGSLYGLKTYHTK